MQGSFLCETLGSLLPHCVAVLRRQTPCSRHCQGWIADSSIQEATSASGRSASSVVCPPNSVFCAFSSLRPTWHLPTRALAKRDNFVKLDRQIVAGRFHGRFCPITQVRIVRFQSSTRPLAETFGVSSYVPHIRHTGIDWLGASVLTPYIEYHGTLPAGILQRPPHHVV